MKIFVFTPTFFVILLVLQIGYAQSWRKAIRVAYTSDKPDISGKDFDKDTPEKENIQDRVVKKIIVTSEDRIKGEVRKNAQGRRNPRGNPHTNKTGEFHGLAIDNIFPGSVVDLHINDTHISPGVASINFGDHSNSSQSRSFRNRFNVEETKNAQGRRNVQGNVNAKRSRGPPPFAIGNAIPGSVVDLHINASVPITAGAGSINYGKHPSQPAARQGSTNYGGHGGRRSFGYGGFYPGAQQDSMNYGSHGGGGFGVNDGFGGSGGYGSGGYGNGVGGSEFKEKKKLNLVEANILGFKFNAGFG